MTNKKYFFMAPILCGGLITGCSSLQKSYEYKIREDIVYKTADGKPILGDIYIPEKSGPKAAVLVVHGGGWTNKAGDMKGICKDLAKSGFVVFRIDYRLAPDSRYPKSVEDVRDAIKWLKQNSGEFEVNPEKMAAWGYSAGANLILLAGLDPKMGLKAIVSGGTPADLTAWPNSPLVFKFIGSALADKPEVWKLASPVNHVEDRSPPVFLYHGEWDHVVEHEQMEKMRKALESKKISVQTHTVSYMGHLAVYVFSQESIDLGIKFLNTHL